ALVSEGTYPFAVGGVSTWCDQLIRGLPEHRWEMVALTVDGTEQPRWPRPENLDAVHQIPLWAPASAGAHRPGSAFLSSWQNLATAMLAPDDPRSPEAMVARSRFVLALRGLYEFAADGGDLVTALTSNAALEVLVSAWRQSRGSGLVLADAVTVADALAHLLRPLAVPPVRVDLVHASMNGLSMLPAMTAKWAYGTPGVMSEHGICLRERYLGLLDQHDPFPVQALLLGFYRALPGAGSLVADGLAPHSAYTRRWQLLNGADPDRMWTMYNGVDPAEYPVAEGEPTDPTVVFMGRINPLKDLHTLIRAFAQVRVRVPRARLRIFGAAAAADAAYAASCQRLIDELGLHGAAVLEGPVPSPVTAFHAATVVALTSISEGFPVTILEAMACGRAIVATNVGGVSEAVADAGIVVAPREPHAVADALTTLLTDHERRHRMAATARERILRLFTLDESIDAYRRLYQQVTGGASRTDATAPERPPS